MGYRKDRGEANFNRLFYSYKANATTRKISFDLTSSEFRAITAMNCFYCGSAPEMKFGKAYSSNGIYTYSGIDRVDNSKGYTADNCVACCKTCNFMKKDVSISIARKMLLFVDGKNG